MPWKRAPNCATGPLEDGYVLRIAQPVSSPGHCTGPVKFLKKPVDCSLDQGENQTTRKALLVLIGRPAEKLTAYMNPVFPLHLAHLSSLRQADVVPCSTATPQESVLDTLVHELRQPLSVIESLAYYLELTSEDEKSSLHLQQIQAMVHQASQILNQATRH